MKNITDNIKNMDFETFKKVDRAIGLVAGLLAGVLGVEMLTFGIIVGFKLIMKMIGA